MLPPGKATIRGVADQNPPQSSSSTQLFEEHHEGGEPSSKSQEYPPARRKEKMCLFCQKRSHWTKQCKLRPERKAERLVMSQRCLRCLDQHSSPECAGESCRNCDAQHHTFLCTVKPRNKKATKIPPTRNKNLALTFVRGPGLSLTLDTDFKEWEITPECREAYICYLDEFGPLGAFSILFERLGESLTKLNQMERHNRRLIEDLQEIRRITHRSGVPDETPYDKEASIKAKEYQKQTCQSTSRMHEEEAYPPLGEGTNGDVVKISEQRIMINRLIVSELCEQSQVLRYNLLVSV